MGELNKRRCRETVQPGTTCPCHIRIKTKNAVVRWRIIVINSVMPESVLSRVAEKQYLTPYAKRES